MQHKFYRWAVTIDLWCLSVCRSHENIWHKLEIAQVVPTCRWIAKSTMYRIHCQSEVFSASINMHMQIFFIRLYKMCPGVLIWAFENTACVHICAYLYTCTFLHMRNDSGNVQAMELLNVIMYYSIFHLFATCNGYLSWVLPTLLKKHNSGEQFL